MKIDRFIFVLQVFLQSAIAKSKNVFEHFLSLERFDHLVMGEFDLGDETLQEIIDTSYNYNIFLGTWNNSGIPIDIHNALIYLDDPNANEVGVLLNQRGSQKALTSNTWLIHTEKYDLTQMQDYFTNSQLRIGLNAKIFFERKAEEDHVLYQALGEGKVKPLLKV